MKILCCIIISCFNFIAQGQAYHSLINTTSTWTTQEPNGGDGYVDDVVFKEYYFYGDTIFLDTLYHIVRYNYQVCDNPAPCHGIFPKETNYYLFEFKKQVYIKSTELFVPMQLLYDFDLEVGDTLPLSYINYGGNYVTGIDSILIGDNYRKRFSISGEYIDNYAYIIEGIGSTYGLLEGLQEPFEYWPLLVCFTSDSMTTYFEPPFIASAADCGLLPVQNVDISFNNSVNIFPNPSNGMFSIDISGLLNTKSLLLYIYNQLGEEVYKNQFDISELLYPVNTNLSTGIYFIYLVADDFSNSISMNKTLVISN
ncbi:MAG: T9SS type A sorting domain-containing protein [Bacteroidetes bacterium]|nr:T9SS type A sorting domain-containing protein [Bacteroidota bacterium]